MVHMAHQSALSSRRDAVKHVAARHPVNGLPCVTLWPTAAGRYGVVDTEMIDQGVWVQDEGFPNEPVSPLGRRLWVLLNDNASR